ncbi:hypothetical protein OK074_6687 [Actinobacteria bacterium OK074]|nr:hypothetical protein OK074_6687 [Actinobacteria bacterium OK074]
MAWGSITKHETVAEIPRHMVQFFLPSDREHGANHAEPEVQKDAGSPDV